LTGIEKLDRVLPSVVVSVMTTRQVLRTLYAKTQEEERLKQIAGIVTMIYDYALGQAKRGPATTFTYVLPQDCNLKEFYQTNMSDIMAGLHERFPDSSITQRSILRAREGTDGYKDHDISTLNPTLISLHGQRLEAIVIDWS
jgi:hypothetical protein